MNNDSKLIFEAYAAKKKMLNEAPPSYAAGDLNISDDKLKSAPGGGYGLKKAAAKTGKSMKEIADALVKKIQSTLFKPEEHKVDGIEYNLYYPGNEMKLRNDLQNLVQSELGLGKTDAAYTARIVKNMLNIVVRDEATGGVATRQDKVASAVKDAVAKPAKMETVYEIEKSVKIGDKNMRALVLSLPDEDVPEKEILGILKAAIVEYNDKPGLAKQDTIKVRPLELVDKLTELGVLKTKQIEQAPKEGEGTGEVATPDDEYPEGDDASSELRFMGAIGRGMGYDPGSFSYGN